jgi:molybdopterin converting factor small subunit
MEQAVEVTVVCFGAFRDYLPDPAAGRIRLSLDGSPTVADVVAHLGIASTALNLSLVDGARADHHTPLVDGAEVTLMPAFSGGAGPLDQEEQR